MAFEFGFTTADMKRLIGSKPLGLADKGFVYKHLNNGSFICPKCAPFLNMQTDGSGNDGVPVPPLHPNCKCYLMPAAMAVLDSRLGAVSGSIDKELWQDHFEWMASLPFKRLALIIGIGRAQMVRDKTVTIPELYDGIYLRPLSEMEMLTGSLTVTRPGAADSEIPTGPG